MDINYQNLSDMKTINIILTLSFCLIYSELIADPPSWTATTGQYSMGVVTEIDLGCGGEAQSGPYTIAAFIDGVVRGVGDGGFVIVYSDSPSGDNVTFQVYDAATDEVLSIGAGITFNSFNTNATVTIEPNNNGNADGDMFCDDEDPCPNTYSNVIGDRDGDGVDDACDQWPDIDNRNDSDGDGIPDEVDDDDCGCTHPTDVILVCQNGVDVRVNCSALSSPGVVCGPCNTCAFSACEDGDPCTSGEIWNDDCTICSGGVVTDADGDGVCDGLDQCPGKDDNRDFDGDGTPDGCDNDPACTTCDVDDLGNIQLCHIYPNGTYASFKANCNDLDDFFDNEGNFKNDQDHCGPCTCASIGDVDSDGDGVCDSKDECPDNPNLQKTGNCSCMDEDDNGDGTADSCNRSICTTSGNTEYEWIASIMIDNQTVQESDNNGFMMHGESKAILTTRNQAVLFDIKPTCLGMDCHLSYAIFADWNGDKDFDDEGEFVARHRGNGGFSGQFVIPADAVANARIRVIVDYGRITGPCDDHIEGEVEDLMLSFEEDCEVMVESFMYDEDSHLNGQGNSSEWNSSWTQDENSIGISQMLSQSLYHPDIQSNGQKLGILNIANSSHSITRELKLSYPTIIQFLYMRGGGKGTFDFTLEDQTLSIHIGDDGQVYLNGEVGSERIEMNRVYRFLIEIRRGADDQAVITLTYGYDSLDGKSSTIFAHSKMPTQQNKLIISTQNSDNFLPIAQYLDELRISCSEDRLAELNSTLKKEKASSLAKKNELNVQVFPNPVINQDINVKIDNQVFFNGHLELINMDGRKVFSKPIISGFDALNTDGLQKGVYLLVIRSSRQVAQKTVVVQ